jgi:hypothetical protein
VTAGKHSQRFNSIASFHDFIAIGSQGIGKMGAAYRVVFDYKDHYSILTPSVSKKQGVSGF